VRGLRRLLRNVRRARGRRRFERVLAADGLFEAHLFERLTVVTGSGVGGGSHTYTNMLEQPPDAYFEAFPPEITAPEMCRHFDRVREMLRPSQLPERERPEKNRVFEQAARAAGFGAPRYPDLAVAWSDGPNAAGAAQSACKQCGHCMLGCEHRAKTTLDLSYLPIALRAGAELHALSEVLAIARDDGAGYRVHARDHRSGRDVDLATPRLVLAAGGLAAAAAIATVHPLCGASIGRTEAGGVVDHTGQVFGHPGLYVADGALYPRAPGIPPSLTIAALAERQSELLAR
jgi:cholesterol oxidase